MRANKRDKKILGALIALNIAIAAYGVIIQHEKQNLPRVTSLIHTKAGCNSKTCWGDGYEVQTTGGTVEVDAETFSKLHVNQKVRIEDGELTAY